MQTQNTQETYVPLTLNTQWGVDISFSSAELTLSLDDFSKRILTPAMARLSSQIDYDGLAQTLNIFNQVGNPGSTPGQTGGSAGTTTDSSSPRVFLNAGMLMDTQATPRDQNRRVIINPAAMASSVSGLSGLYNDQELISEQYRKGVLGVALGFEFAMDQNVNSITTGTHAGSSTAYVNSAGQTGSVLSTSGWTANSNVFAQGEIFTITGVYGVNPENQVSTGFLQNFVCLNSVTSDSNGNANINIYPSIVVAGAGVAAGTVTASPAYNSSLTLGSGSANTAYPVNIAYHQDAFTLGTADLEMPRGVDFTARETYDGISLRIVRAFDISNDQFPCRIDVLGGWATLRPELGCRITG